MKRAIVVGGGPAGLALAWDLARGGLDVSLYEASNELGGLAASCRLGDISIDKYYHFICGGDYEYFERLENLGLSSKLAWNTTTTGYFLKGKQHSFANPLEILNCDALSYAGRLKYLAFAAQCKVRNDWEDLDDIKAVDWLEQWVGKETYELTWKPLLELKMRKFYKDISAAWVWHRVHRVAQSRKGLGWYEQMGYLKGGTQVLVDALVEAARKEGVKIHLTTPVRRILREGDRCVGVELGNGEVHRCDIGASTVPLPHFTKLAGEFPWWYVERQRAIEFLAVRCVTLRLRHAITDHFWLNVNHPEIPYNGIIEYSNLNPGYVADGSRIVYVPFYLEREDPLWSEHDSILTERVTKTLHLLNPDFKESWVIDSMVGRDPYAQPVCTTGFGRRIPSHRTPLDNFYLLESTQLYPEDRSVSAAMSLAKRVGTMMLEAVKPQMAYLPSISTRELAYAAR